MDRNKEESTKTKLTKVAIFSMGIYLVVDGAASIVAFIDQPYYTHLVRIGRIIIGLILIFGGLLEKR